MSNLQFQTLNQNSMASTIYDTNTLHPKKSSSELVPIQIKRHQEKIRKAQDLLNLEKAKF